MGSGFSCRNRRYDSCKPFITNNRVSVIGVPLGDGQDWEHGVEEGPAALRQAGLKAVITDLGYDVVDTGDIDCTYVSLSDEHHPLSKPESYGDSDVKNASSIGNACERLFHQVIQSSRDFVLTLGGDHSIAVATIAAQLTKFNRLCVVWVDAHGDCNTPETSLSQNYHGMPAAHVMKWFKKPLRGFEWLEPVLSVSPLKETNLVYIGLRDLDEAEKRLLRASGVKVFSVREIDRYGIGQIMELCLAFLPRNSPIHLSLDIDGVDPQYAPGTGTKARGGLSYREVHYITERLAETRRLVSMDLVEINPSLDSPPLLPLPAEDLQQACCASSSTNSMSCHNDVELMNYMHVGVNGTCCSSTRSGTAGGGGDEEQDLAGSGGGGVWHGDHPLIATESTTVRLGVELVAAALGKRIY